MSSIPTKSIPDNYHFSGSVSLKNIKDVSAMLVWSIILFILAGLLGIAVILLISQNEISLAASFSINSFPQLLQVLGGLVLVTVIMLVLHEGLHGLVFWMTTHEPPKFAFKWYYASASPGDWYLPRTPFLTATLLPLAVITVAGLVLLPFTSGLLRYLILILVVFNASGAAGDVLVALRLLRLPTGTLSLDKGDEVRFFSPVENIV
jgi:hypothetical protein